MSIFLKIFLSISLVTIITITIFVNYLINITKEDFLDRLNNKIEYHQEINKLTISKLLFDLNKDILESNLNSLYLDKDIAKIELKDYSMVINLTLDNKNLKKDDLIKSTAKLFIEDEILGELVISYSKEQIYKSLEHFKKDIVIVSFSLILLILSITYYFIKQSSKSVKELVYATNKISSGELDFEVNVNTNDEIGFLARKFAKMRDSLKKRINELHVAKEKIEKFNEELKEKVYERTEELEESNEELQVTISNLKQTQEQLIESEKMASLG